MANISRIKYSEDNSILVKGNNEKIETTIGTEKTNKVITNGKKNRRKLTNDWKFASRRKNIKDSAKKKKMLILYVLCIKRKFTWS